MLCKCYKLCSTSCLKKAVKNFCGMINSGLLCSMNRSQWIALAAGVTLAIACFMPWVYIQNPDITISGVESAGTRFGKPGYIHFIFTGLILCFTLINRVWAKRFNLLLAALNMAWAIKNFIIIGRCEAGECPEKQIGFYLLLFSAFVLLGSTLFPGIKLPASTTASVEEDIID